MPEAKVFLDEYIKGLSKSSKKEEIDVFRDWEGVAGKNLAAHSSVKDIHGTTLIVAADHPVFIQEINLRQNEIIQKVNRAFPGLAINSISVKSAPAEKTKPIPTLRPPKVKIIEKREKPLSKDSLEREKHFHAILKEFRRRGQERDDCTGEDE